LLVLLGSASTRLADRPELQILRQLELQFGLGRNLLFSTGEYLRTNATCERAEQRTDGSPAANILRRALVRAESCPACLAALRGKQVPAAPYRNRPEVHYGILAILAFDPKLNWRNADTCAWIQRIDWSPIHSADWNQKLRALTEAQEQYEQRREQDRQVFNEEQRAAIMGLAQDFPRLWRDPATEDRDRKRMIRLLVEDVTMLRSEQITLHVRFRGGAARTVTLPNPLRWKAG
jgi:hypothetical protein